MILHFHYFNSFLIFFLIFFLSPSLLYTILYDSLPSSLSLSISLSLYPHSSLFLLIIHAELFSFTFFSRYLSLFIPRFPFLYAFLSLLSILHLLIFFSLYLFIYLPYRYLFLFIYFPFFILLSNFSPIVHPSPFLPFSPTSLSHTYLSLRLVTFLTHCSFSFLFYSCYHFFFFHICSVAHPPLTCLPFMNPPPASVPDSDTTPHLFYWWLYAASCWVVRACIFICFSRVKHSQFQLGSFLHSSNHRATRRPSILLPMARLTTSVLLTPTDNHFTRNNCYYTFFYNTNYENNKTATRTTDLSHVLR